MYQNWFLTRYRIVKWVKVTLGYVIKTYACPSGTLACLASCLDRPWVLIRCRSMWTTERGHSWHFVCLRPSGFALFLFTILGLFCCFFVFVKYSSVSVYFYECTTRGKSWQKQNNYPCASDINNVIYLVFHKIVNREHQLLVWLPVTQRR